MTTNKKMTQELNDKNNSKRESLLKLLCNMQDIWKLVFHYKKIFFKKGLQKIYRFRSKIFYF